MTRKYSSVSVSTTLTASITDTATTMTVADATNLLLGVTLAAGNVDRFAVVIDSETASEEVVFVTGVSATNTLTIVRNVSGSSGVSHNIGATVKHALVSEDLNSFEATNNAAVTATSTNTLTNKTINAANNTLTGVLTASSTDTVTNKNLASGTNTFPSTLATVSGTETLTNKTLTDPKLNLAVNAQTGTTYTFALTDNGKFITASNASAQTYTIPTNASVAFPVGSQIHVIQIGVGQVTVSGSAGVTILSTGATAATPKTYKQYAALTCVKTDTDTWYVMGNLA